MTRSRYYILFLWLCAVLFLSGAKAQAQQSLGLIPAMVDASVKRGLTYTQNFTIANNTVTKLRFRCSTGDFWYDDHNGRVFGRPGTLPRSASLWVQFAPEEVIIEPHTTATVRAVISVPKDASGGYYTIPFFEGEPADLPTDTNRKAASNVAVRLGGLLMLATEGASEYNVEVKGSKVLPPTASSELELQLDVHNSGTAHVRLHGRFAILDNGGKLVGHGLIEEKRYLPGQRDTVSALSGDDLKPGHYTAVITLTHDRAGMEPATLVYELPFDLK